VFFILLTNEFREIGANPVATGWGIITILAGTIALLFPSTFSSTAFLIGFFLMIVELVLSLLAKHMAMKVLDRIAEEIANQVQKNSGM